MVERGKGVGPASGGGFDYDAELRCYQRRLRDVIDVGPGDVVLDIGCGTGLTTREAARLAVRGSALGVDTSPVVVARARQLAAAEELHNVRYEQGDAQVHPFPARHFSLGISRFGTMFFADPDVAFANICRALRPGARFVQLVWQAGDRQEWVVAVHRAIAGGSAPPPSEGGPFSLAEPSTVDGVLTAAGFTDVHLTDLREPVFYGTGPDAALDAVLALRIAGDLLAGRHADETRRALDRLRATMAEHTTADGVWFDSRAWLVTARRPA